MCFPGQLKAHESASSLQTVQGDAVSVVTSQCQAMGKWVMTSKAHHLSLLLLRTLLGAGKAPQYRVESVWQRLWLEGAEGLGLLFFSSRNSHGIPERTGSGIQTYQHVDCPWRAEEIAVISDLLFLLLSSSQSWLCVELPPSPGEGLLNLTVPRSYPGSIKLQSLYLGPRYPLLSKLHGQC